MSVATEVVVAKSVEAIADADAKSATTVTMSTMTVPAMTMLGMRLTRHKSDRTNGND